MQGAQRIHGRTGIQGGGQCVLPAHLLHGPPAPVAAGPTSRASRGHQRRRVRPCPSTVVGLQPVANGAMVDVSAHQLSAPVVSPQQAPAWLPLQTCETITLPPQTSLHSAAAALQAAAADLCHSHGQLKSGCVRIEAPVPATSTALHWLASQLEAPAAAQPGKPDSITSEAARQPSIYFSGRNSLAADTPLSAQAERCTQQCTAIAGLGAAWHWQGSAGAGFDPQVMSCMQRFLSGEQPRMRVLGGTRFDPASAPGPEWASFGAYFFLLPLVEFSECGSGALLAVTVAWDSEPHTQPPAHDSTTASPVHTPRGAGPDSLDSAMQAALSAIRALRTPGPLAAGLPSVSHTELQHTPSEAEWGQVMKDLLADLGAKNGASRAKLAGIDLDWARSEYVRRGQQSLDDLLALVGGSESRPSQTQGVGEADTSLEDMWDSLISDPDSGGDPDLRKVVLARRSMLRCQGDVRPLWILQALQERDPRAYQLFMTDGSGSSFLSSTPERLYARTGRMVTSEAVAATRPRGPPGDVEQDFWLSVDLLNSDKDHREFVLVRDWVRDALSSCAHTVHVEVPKTVIKQGSSMQHLYGRLAAELRPDVSDTRILQALHPTPAVCGRPRDTALHWLREREGFDRGYYAGPFGWVSGQGAEFAVAIRSSLISDTPTHTAHTPATHVAAVAPHRELLIHLYAGVGVVPGSDAASEWQELNLKTGPIRRLLQPVKPIHALPNINLAWASLLVEECCRQGVNVFCVAPGSRSSPLALAVIAHPRAQLNVCIDERSLGFWAVGYGRATGRPAVVITSSGTAVANLLPACVEASQSNVPMLMVTADRPTELRDTGANQTIDQVKIFGGYTRWFADVSPPSDAVPGRVLLTTLATALRHVQGAGAGVSGPVHLNMQFREPLAPMSAPWDSTRFMEGLGRWSADPTQPYTDSGVGTESAVDPGSHTLQRVCGWLGSAQRGLLVIGELTSPGEVLAAVELSRVLGWPVVTDILSGLRTLGSDALRGCHVVPYMDHVLLGDKEWWAQVAPDVIVQVGPRLTSKRLNQFMEWCAGRSDVSPALWVYVGPGAARHDAAHLVTAHLPMTCSALLAHLRTQPPTSPSQSQYTQLLTALSKTAHEEITSALSTLPTLTEPHVARHVTDLLPRGHAMYLGNSMPIRDADMYAQVRGGSGDVLSSAVRTGANRGASGIDGVLSTAAGFAEGVGRPTTLVIGDLSFQHDVNGLSLLRAGETRPPLTVVLINNNGGGIFSFLPIAGAVATDQFEPLWGTPQHTDFEGICRSYGLPYQRVSDLGQLQRALESAWGLNRHSVVEVVTQRNTNVHWHRYIQGRVSESVSQLHRWVQVAPPQLPVLSVSWVPYALPLTRPLTSTANGTTRHGLVVRVRVQCGGSVYEGVGEVAPLPGLHTESVGDCVAQLCMVRDALLRHPVPLSVGLLGGRMEAYLSHVTCGGVDVMYPSVRMGLETALLHCVAQARGSPTLLPQGQSHTHTPVRVNGLIASSSLDECVREATHLVQGQGYTALKIKVARSSSTPVEDAKRVLSIRKAVGPDVALRADANRGWSLQQATDFGLIAQQAGLEYIEEPVTDPEDLEAFYDATGIPFALDESLDTSDPLGVVKRYAVSHTQTAGLAALVLKPTRLGGFDPTLRLAAHAQSLGVRCVVSSCFESPLGLSALVELAGHIDRQAASHGATATPTHHGLGTVEWFTDMAHAPSLAQPTVHATEATHMTQCAQGLTSSSSSSSTPEPSVQWQRWSEQVQGLGAELVSFTGVTATHTHNTTDAPHVVFLHGFLGSKEDWHPIMSALSSQGATCTAVDIPGQGAAAASVQLSIEQYADSVAQVLRRRCGSGGCTLVGYSLGARMALALTTRHPDIVNKLVFISGTPGIKDPAKANQRALADASLAGVLRERGLASFVDTWYRQGLWGPLRRSPAFPAVMERRVQSTVTADQWADLLTYASTGHMGSMWGALPSLTMPVLVISGALDAKYCRVCNHMMRKLPPTSAKYVSVAGAGHAVHMEKPLHLLQLLRDFAV